MPSRLLLVDLNSKQKDITVEGLKKANFPTTFFANYYLKLGMKPIPVFGVTKNGCLCQDASCKSPGKHPMISDWQDYAIALNAENFKDLWRQFDEYPCNIGIVTGRISNVFVIDIDTKDDGMEHFRKWEKENETIETTWRVITGSGGYHLYLRYPRKDIMGQHKIETITNKVRALPGVDFRGDGGFVVAPPSIHISGKNYEWEI